MGASATLSMEPGLKVISVNASYLNCGQKTSSIFPPANSLEMLYLNLLLVVEELHDVTSKL